MHLTLNPFAVILFVSGLATIIMAMIIYSRLKSAEKSFALVIGLAGWWAITYSGELFSTTLSAMLVWLKFEYVGITLIPPALLLFIRVFISNHKFSFKPVYLLLFIIPVFTFILVVSNDPYHLYYSSLAVDNQGSFPVLTIKPAFWYHIFTAYFYITLAFSILALLKAFKRGDQIYKKQKNIILYALIIPWIFNIVYKIGIGPNQNIDLTPFAFIATSLIISFGLLRYKLLDIIPASREKIFESMQDGVLVLNAANTIVDMNRRMHQFLPPFTEEVIGLNLTELFPTQKNLHSFVLERKHNTLEMEVDGENGPNYFEVDINILSDRKSDYSGSILIFKNITQHKKDAIALLALNKQKDRLFSIIGHDIRSPLINIMEMVRLIDEQAITEKEFKLFLPELSKNLNYTSSLLDNLLHWSKSQLKGETINPERLEIGNMIRHEIAYYQQKATEKNIYLSSNIENEIWVIADAEMIQLVIRNLIGNAIKYCTSEDCIIASASFTSLEAVTICIKDTGSGMKSETVDRLFMFENFTTRGTNNEQGTGLGLQLCKDFVEKNNGTIWVTTELGIGSKFYFTIPLAQAKSFPASKSIY